MGRKSKLKQQRKQTATNPDLQSTPQTSKGDIEVMTHLGYGDHNLRRSPDLPDDRPEPQL